MGKTSSRSESSTRADQKFEKKLQFYTKVKETVASLGAQKTISKKKKLRSRQKKLKAYDLSALTEFLPELKKTTPQLQSPAIALKLNCKTRQNVVLKEGNQMKTVLGHTAFQTDPLAAIYQHLQSTQPVMDEKPKIRKNVNGSKKAKGKRSKATTPGTRSMEI